MPRTAEAVFNAEFANALRGKHPRWRERVGAEQTGVLRDASARRPDVVIRHPGGLIVIVETEFAPAKDVEDDARGRLGEIAAETGEAVEQAIAVRVPDALRGGDQARLPERIAAASFDFCAFLEGTTGGPTRWPASGWLHGGLDDLAGFIERTALSERRIAQGMLILEVGVREAAGRLREDLWNRPYALPKVAAALHQEPSEQTVRMAMAILANALTFHTAIAAVRDIPTLDELRGPWNQPLKSEVLRTWRRILHEINYWPIFRIASDVLLPIPDGAAATVLDRLTVVAGALDKIGATSTHELSGQMFGRLIADRKFLATFYTRPASSALLAELAAERLTMDWTDPAAFTDLRIADLACGTGALLAAAYRAVAARHRRAGGDDEPLHQVMMERALIGADIMPAATHLTASTLSSSHPSVTFDRTRIHTMPYGEQDADGGSGRPVAIGSLDLILSDEQPSLFGTGQHVLRGTGEAIGVDTGAAYGLLSDEIRVPRGSVDLMIMNPPFTRPTGQEAASIGVPVPSFAGFATSEDEQRRMSDVLKGVRQRLKHPVGHGNAGLASNFIDLAHVKVKPGGVLALVLPLAVVSGGAWSQARRLLACDYRDLTVVTIAAAGDSHERAFSADTGIAEALVVAVKRDEPVEADESSANALYVNLRWRPRSLVEATEIARAVDRLPDIRSGLVYIGHDEAGCFIRASLADGGCSSLRSPVVAEAAFALGTGTLRLPHTREAKTLPVTKLASIGARGLYHMDISGKETSQDGIPRGPFDVIPVRDVAPTYPMLWAHSAARERRLIVEPDSEGWVRQDCKDKALDVWETATRLHFNRDFRLNSQGLAACLTPKRSIGGRAWPNFCLNTCERGEAAVVLWANTTLGLLWFWWIGGRQQQGRAIISITQLPSLLTVDLRQLSDTQIQRSQAIFEDFREREFLPANEAYHDETRQALDEAVLVELLGLPETILEPLALLRLQWCQEPTVHGGKATRPT